jgi:hypothetical protein
MKTCAAASAQNKKTSDCSRKAKSGFVEFWTALSMKHEVKHKGLK